MFKLYLLLFFSFFSISTFAQDNLIKINDAIISELKASLVNEQIFSELEEENLKIEISYNKIQDIESVSFKSFELQNLNINNHEFIGNLDLVEPLGKKIHISGKFQILVSLPVLKMKLPKNHIIREIDIEKRFFNADQVSSALITEQQDLIGMTLRKMLKANIPIKKEFITSAIIVKKNDVISLEHNRGNVTIKALVTSLDSGSVGDFIRVKNAKTKQIMNAVIINDTTVKLKLN